MTSSSATLTHGETLSKRDNDADLSNAFQLIDRVPLENLYAHRKEAVSAFNKLCMLFSANAVSRPLTISVANKPPSAPPLGEQIADGDSTSALLKSLTRQQEEIKDYLSLSEIEAIRERKAEKPRTIARSSVSFRNVLSDRSLAFEYEKWELAKFKTSKVAKLLKNLNHEQTSRNGHVSDFLGYHGDGKDKEAARKRVRLGIKLLVFERLCQKTVVSAVLSFACTNFRTLKFEELPLLKTMLVNLPWISRILNEKEHWYNQCQERYDGRYTHKLRKERSIELDMSSSEPNAKRPKTMQENCADKSNGTDNSVKAALRSPGDYHPSLY